MRGATDPRRSEALFLVWLRAAVAARDAAAAPPAPGRRTQVLDGRDGSHTPRADELRGLYPGKWTRVLLETGREAEVTGGAPRALPAYNEPRVVGAPGAVPRHSDEPYSVPVPS